MFYPAAMTDLSDELFLVLPDGTEQGPAAPTLSFSRTPVVLLNFAANRFTRLAARQNQEEFGIGAMEWRMLVMLTREPGSSVSHAARTIGIDKAAVSRALQRMEKAGLAAATCPGGDDRRKDWTLTEKGAALHARMLPQALERQRQALEGFSESEAQAFAGYQKRFLGNLES
jgi:DNA-binding MarR family transcriptional regulator